MIPSGLRPDRVCLPAGEGKVSKRRIEDFLTMNILIDILYMTGMSMLLLIGILGCVVPAIPGPALSYAALLLLLPSRFAPSVGACVLFGIGCVAVLVLDTVVPALGAKRFKCSRWGVAGCMIGTVVGMFFGVLGLVSGPFIGAVSGEIVAGRSFPESVRGGLGAFLGFLSGVLLKMVYCAICSGWCIYSICEVLIK